MLNRIVSLLTLPLTDFNFDRDGSSTTAKDHRNILITVPPTVPAVEGARYDSANTEFVPTDDLGNALVYAADYSTERPGSTLIEVDDKYYVTGQMLHDSTPYQRPIALTCTVGGTTDASPPVLDETDIGTTIVETGGVEWTADGYSTLEGYRNDPEATNIVWPSEDGSALGLSNLLAFGSGSVLNADTAPDGTLTADKFVENTADNFHYIVSTNFDTVLGKTYWFKYYIKTAGITHVSIESILGGTRSCVVDLSDGSYVNTAIETTPKIIKIRDYWEINVGFIANATASGKSFRVFFTQKSSDGGYVGDGVSGIYGWGLQVTEDTPAAYIPTITASVLRGADELKYLSATYLKANDMVVENKLTLSSTADQVLWGDGVDGLAIVSGELVFTGGSESVTTVASGIAADTEITIQIILSSTAGKEIKVGGVSKILDGAKVADTAWDTYFTVGGAAVQHFRSFDIS